MIRIDDDKSSLKSDNSHQPTERHQDKIDDSGVILLPSSARQPDSIFTRHKRRFWLLVAVCIAILNFIVTLRHRITGPRIDPIPDPIIEHYPDWLEGIPVEDPGTARYFAPSYYTNESVAVKDLYLNKILDTDYKMSDDPDKKMLIVILTSSDNFQRRQILRAHQIHPYKVYTNITWRFVLGSPPPAYRTALKYENDTYGDLIFLENVPDTRDIARSIKLLEFYKYVEESLPVYKYVGKLDTDSFVNIAGLMKNYFNETVDNLDLASIGAVVRLGKLSWPQGGFFMFTYKLMIFVNRMYSLVPRTVYEEDFQIGWYLNDAGVNYTFVELPSGQVAFDWNDHFRDIFNDTIRIHELKKETDYMNIANCFDASGVNNTQVLKMRESDWH
jgi:hypothetical protein